MFKMHVWDIMCKRKRYFAKLITISVRIMEADFRFSK